VARKARDKFPVPGEQAFQLVPESWSNIPLGELDSWILFLERMRELYTRYHRAAVQEFRLRAATTPMESGVVVSPVSIESAERFGEF